MAVRRPCPAVTLALVLALGLGLLGCTDDEPAQPGELDGPATSQEAPATGADGDGSSPGTLNVTGEDAPPEPDGQAPDRSTVPGAPADGGGDGESTPTTSDPDGNAPDLSTQP